MLKGSYRLKKNKEFRYIYSTGQSVAAKGAVLYFNKRDDEERKIGFSVSKKIGKAHTRNFVKRRMRACMANYINHISPGTNLIFSARKPMVDFSYSRIESEMKYLLKKSGVWNEVTGETNITGND